MRLWLRTPSDMEIVLIKGGDGLGQIAEAMKDRHDMDAVHILSHGSEGTLF